MRSPLDVIAVLVVLVALPAPAAAQLGAIEAFARRVTDLSFYANVGGLAPRSADVKGDALDIRSFGVELFFEIGTVEEVIGPAPAVADTATLTWTEMVVVRSEDGVDTTYVYEVGPPRRPSAPTRVIWTFEMGIGYGQLVGFDAAAEGLELRGQVRDLPSASLYANYDPLGFYLGLRSGFMKVQGLQLFDEEGNPFNGSAESFLMAIMLGQAKEVLGINVFVEGAYSLRYFPSVDWRGAVSGVPLPTERPRELSFSGWSIGLGVQFGLGT
jgi:hypothetical protein